MADQPVYRAAEKYDHAYEAHARLSRDHVALRRRYADLCRAVVLLADDTMLRAQWAACASEPGDPAEVIAGIARRMLALVPDTPPDRPAIPTDQSSTGGQQDSTKTQEPLWCKATDHDLTTNRPLRCDRDYHRDAAHHWVFADARGLDSGSGRAGT